jgi:hypothetical protein
MQGPNAPPRQNAETRCTRSSQGLTPGRIAVNIAKLPVVLHRGYLLFAFGDGRAPETASPIAFPFPLMPEVAH